MQILRSKQKIRHNTSRGFLIALLGSAYLYLAWMGWSHPLPNTLLGILALYLLLDSNKTTWFWSGFFIGLLWFWWISMSFRLYGFAWAMPIGILLTAFVYGLLFWVAASIAEWMEGKLNFLSLWLKALFLLLASFIHPFGFDWFKMELLFVESYLGVEMWQYAIILFSIVFALATQRLWYLLLIILAYQPTIASNSVRSDINSTKLVTTYIPTKEKFNPAMLPNFIQLINQHLNQAIEAKKQLIIFPESILPLFLNKKPSLLEYFRDKSEHISIVIGALHWDDNVPRNSAFIFKKGKMIIADKVMLVPFGESNPLPDWLSDLVNAIFYDGAVDYKASDKITDYTIDNITYRNAICYEACSEELYQGKPKKMIVLSNNGWFLPSIEPTQQRLLLEYYSRKYSTTIYHSINASPSYVIQNGKIVWIDKEY